MALDRTAFLIRCSVEEAEAIRRTARVSGQTISRFVLDAVKLRIKAHEKVKALEHQWLRLRKAGHNGM